MAGKALAAMRAATIPPVRSPASFPRERILSETPAGPDEVVLEIEIQTPGRLFVRPPVRMRRHPDGWKEVLTSETVQEIVEAIEAMTPSQRARFMRP